MTQPAFASATPPAAVLATSRGDIAIFSHATEQMIADLAVDNGFGAVFRASRAREEFTRIARREDGNVLLAVATPGVIMGYLLLERPIPVAWQQRVMHQRWAECEAIVELAAMEVSRNFRRLRVAEGMLRVVAADPGLQDKIVIATALRRYWDL
ncbi:MAG: hypothetical protein NTZ05_18805, partial [Chloroflexi bacterium]|nr:hypothetical protein [Chloroflexota bacterium]